mmetsp:Transcript_85465/g.250162  ORF Transcript_85465/g.250162 Transcript_85465/m.250162 type:complete len:286 (+) Transcript_85465:307-1164(+)
MSTSFTSVPASSSMKPGPSFHVTTAPPMTVSGMASLHVLLKASSEAMLLRRLTKFVTTPKPAWQLTSPKRVARWRFVAMVGSWVKMERKSVDVGRRLSLQSSQTVFVSWKPRPQASSSSHLVVCSKQPGEGSSKPAEAAEALKTAASGSSRQASFACCATRPRLISRPSGALPPGSWTSPAPATHASFARVPGLVDRPPSVATTRRSSARRLKQHPVIMTTFRARSAQAKPSLPRATQQQLCSTQGASFMKRGAAGSVNSLEKCRKQDFSLLLVGAQKPPQMGTL